MFTTDKVAQMAAFFASKASGSINILKLMKLMYLSDRESMDRYGYPITYDNMASLPHGPVLIQTLDLINGTVSDEDGATWDKWISDRANNIVAAVRVPNRDDLDQLSDIDLDILESVWAKFGTMGKWAIRDWTHEHCPEWTDPHGSVIPIREADLLKALGRSDPEAKAGQDRITAQRRLDSVLARL